MVGWRGEGGVETYALHVAKLQLALGEWCQPGAARDEHDVKTEDDDAVDEVEGVRRHASADIVV